MSSVFELALQRIDTLTGSFITNIVEPSKMLQHVAGIVREDGTWVHSFASNTILPHGFSLGAVDGGNASEKLSAGDLIISAATFAEGRLPHVYSADGADIPTEVYSSIMPHFSSNDKIERAMRALLELRVLVQAKTSMRIIDGSYLGNIANVLYALIDPDSRVSNEVLNWEVFEKADGLLEEAFHLLLHPVRGSDNWVVGVPKSDSSTAYVDKILTGLNVEAQGVADRMLAGVVLKPGEFLTPRNVESVPGLISTLDKTLKMDNFGKKSFDKPSLLKFVNDKAGLLRRLGLDATEEGLMWTTYFKPSSWEEFSPVVRVEFLFYPNEGVDILDRCREIVSVLDQDFVGPTILEPWSQYMVDREAKGVSQALTVTKEYLLSQSDDPRSVMGLVRGYRT